MNHCKNTGSSKRKQRGLSTVEYAIAGGLITLSIVLAFTTLGTAVTNRIGTMIGALDSANPQPAVR